MGGDVRQTEPQLCQVHPLFERGLYQGIVGCTLSNVPLWPYGKFLYKPFFCEYLWSIIPKNPYKTWRADPFFWGGV